VQPHANWPGKKKASDHSLVFFFLSFPSSPPLSLLMHISPDLAFCFLCSGKEAVQSRHAMPTREITWTVVGASLLGCPHHHFPTLILSS
jgi:hypothetical protein